MKRILLAILSSQQELYTRSTQLLKSAYKNMCNKYLLNVDVISYTSGDSNKLDGDTLYIACEDNDLNAKSKGLAAFIKDHPEYDVIVKTNATTVVNLQLLTMFVNGNYFDQNIAYGCSCLKLLEYREDLPDPQLITLYLSGNFTMLSTELFNNTIGDIKCYNEALGLLSQYNPNRDDRGGYYDIKLGDDEVWGVVFKNKSTQLATLPALSFSAHPFNFNRENRMCDIIAFETNTRTQYEDRMRLEPIIINAVSEYFMEYRPTMDDYVYLNSNIRFCN